MSNKRLESFEKFIQILDQRQSNWEMAGGSSEEKEPSEAKNRELAGGSSEQKEPSEAMNRELAGGSSEQKEPSEAKNRELAGGSSEEKEPSKAKNRSELNKTYIIYKPMPEELVETPNMDKKFHESGTNDQGSGVSQIKPMSKIPKPVGHLMGSQKDRGKFL